MQLVQLIDLLLEFLGLGLALLLQGFLFGLGLGGEGHAGGGFFHHLLHIDHTHGANGVWDRYPTMDGQRPPPQR